MEAEVYKKAYFKLFNAITDALAIGAIKEAADILVQAQIDCEEMIISVDDNAQ